MSRTPASPARRFFQSPLYGVVDPEQLKGRSPTHVFQALLQGGVSVIQLRVKNLPAKNFLDLAREAREQTRAHNCFLVINDRVDIALAARADGVHLGQEDLPFHAARKLMGTKLIGVSTHDLAQAQAAEQDGADYIGFGPIFRTKTKQTGYAPRGVAMLQEIRRVVSLPIVAIGGITEANVAQVWQSGADAAAIISDLLHAEDITEKVKTILSLRP
ncbi:MAG: thiamine phosphate synthase [Candidatus Binatia bacterium]